MEVQIMLVAALPVVAVSAKEPHLSSLAKIMI
jgi:hypothetical protein